MKDKIYRFAYTGLLSFWTNKDMKKFFERKRSTRFKSFKKRKPKMKKLLFIPVVVLFMIGCKQKNWFPEKPIHDTVIVKVHDTITLKEKKPSYDSIAAAFRTKPIVKIGAIKIGDTVVATVIMHGAQIGVVRQIKDTNYYIDFFTCICNGWYNTSAFSPILPYSYTWNQIKK